MKTAEIWLLFIIMYLKPTLAYRSQSLAFLSEQMMNLSIASSSFHTSDPIFEKSLLTYCVAVVLNNIIKLQIEIMKKETLLFQLLLFI